MAAERGQLSKASARNGLIAAAVVVNALFLVVPAIFVFAEAFRRELLSIQLHYRNPRRLLQFD